MRLFELFFFIIMSATNKHTGNFKSVAEPENAMDIMTFNGIGSIDAGSLLHPLHFGFAYIFY